MKKEFINREISWLSFNYRVLQEAKDPKTPLFEKIKFLAIFSSNLDEFFRVRVAAVRSTMLLKEKQLKKLSYDPEELLNEIYQIVDRHQNEFGKIYRDIVLPELRENNIYLIDEKELAQDHKEYLDEYFEENIREYIQPVIINNDIFQPFLQNKQLYFAVKIKSDESYFHALVHIPTDIVPRFISLPNYNEKKYLIFLDDVIPYSFPRIFNCCSVEEAYSIKLTRDADMKIGDEFTGDLRQKIKKGIKKRSTGIPCRFLYDNAMPGEFLSYLKKVLRLENEESIPGGRYHNFNDFFGFPPKSFEHAEMEKFKDERLPPLELKKFKDHDTIFEVIKEKDRLLYFPYHTYQHVIDFFFDAAEDPDVTAIKATQYRVAENSAIVQSLIRAAQKGKKVVVFVELKARFDEEANINWAEEMEKNGVKVYYSFPKLKVHAKISLVTRSENGEEVNYSYLSTGNFNESNARIYTDLGFFTADKRITGELKNVFSFLERKGEDHQFEHLLVAQFNMRDEFIRLLKNEMENAKEGKKAEVIIKVNGLEDNKMIKQLYKASNAGVDIKILCRGICCLKPGIEGMSENIEVISIVDRFLEHSRIYVFHNDGDKLVFAASADWMKRNLSRRVEVGFPIYDNDVRKQILDTLDIQLGDNQKARIIDPALKNEYVSNDKAPIRSQHEMYKYFEGYE